MRPRGKFLHTRQVWKWLDQNNKGSVLLWKIFRVTGNSMAPTIEHGDFVVAQKYKKPPVEGTVAVIYHPILGNLIKRINKIPGTKMYMATGDNDISIRNTSIGSLKASEIVYQAILRVSPSGLTRLKPRRNDFK